MMKNTSRKLTWGDSILSHFSLRYADFAERVEAAAAAGFNGIGLFIAPYLELVGQQGHSPADLKKLLDQSGLQLAEIEVLSGWSSGNAGRATCAHWLDAACRMTEVFGSRHLAVIGSYDGTLDDATRDLRWICDAAAEVNLQVSIEFLPFTNIRTAADALLLAENTGRANCGVTLDTWHHFRGAKDWAMLEAVPAARIGCIQVNDGALVPEHDDYFTDNISNRRVLGQGEFDLSRFFALLKEKQLDVPVSVEVISTALQAQPSADVAQQLHASLMRYYSA